MRWLTGILWVVCVLLGGYLTLPVAQTSLWGVGVALVWTGVCGGLCVIYHERLTNWRGLGVVAGGCILALAWLRWLAPDLTFSTLNSVVGVLAWGLFVALIISSLLLLIRRDASVTFMGLAWLLVSLILLIMGRQYGRLETFSAAPLAEQTWLGMPIAWGMLMLCLGLPIFIAHSVILMLRELTWQ